jgi:hypothetical protein
MGLFLSLQSHVNGCTMCIWISEHSSIALCVELLLLQELLHIPRVFQSL